MSKITSKTPSLEILRGYVTDDKWSQWSAQTGGEPLRLLALDLGTTSGFAQYDLGCGSDGSLTRTAVAICHGNFQADTAGKVFRGFTQYLDDRLLKRKPDYIAYEDVRRFGAVVNGRQTYNSQAARRWDGLLAIVQMVSEGYGIPLIPVPIMSAKKVVTGYGHAPKAEVQTWANSFLRDHNPALLKAMGGLPTEDEADATMMAEWVYLSAQGMLAPSQAQFENWETGS